jgi:protein O-GlcNAc transferase
MGFIRLSRRKLFARPPKTVVFWRVYTRCSQRHSVRRRLRVLGSKPEKMLGSHEHAPATPANMNPTAKPSTASLLQTAQAHKDAGRLNEALQGCDAILASTRANAGALHLRGAVLHLLGRPLEAIEDLRRAVAAEPNNARFWVTLGGNLAISGKMDEAASCFEAAIRADSESADAHLNLGFARKHQKRFADAEVCFRQTLRLAPNHAGALANLGLCKLELGDVDKAYALALQALDLSPSQPLALLVAANAEARRGNASEADVLARLGNDTIDQATLSTLAQRYLEMGKTGIAKAIYAHAAQRNPNDWESLSAVALLELGELRITDALTTARRAVAASPESPGALMTLGIVASHAGAFDEAKKSLSKSIRLRPVFGAKLLHDLMLPPVVTSTEHITTIRKSFEDALNHLSAERPRSEHPFLEMGYTYFYLAFHGQNDLHLQKKIAAFYIQTAPTLGFIAPHTNLASRPAGSRQRVGFYSRFIYKHSVAASFSKVIEAMTALNAFDIFLISDASPEAYDIESAYPTLHKNCVTVRRDLEAARDRIASLELDTLVYLDIGMDPLSYQLAFARLAKVQAVMGGHPVTTGIPTVDYFLSAAGLEAPDAQTHYSERLLLLEHGGFEFERPTYTARDNGRTVLGAAEAERVYFCPMMLQKMHPDFDRAMEAILLRDPNGVVVLVESGFSPEWTSALKSRLASAMRPDAIARVRFVPWISNGQDFFSAIHAADVIIDSFHFGIGTTSIQVFAAGTPLVTLPGAFSRGRVGMYFSKLIGVEDGIATDEQDFVERAVRIANNPALRTSIRERVLANNHRLFHNPDASKELASTLLSLTAPRAA